MVPCKHFYLLSGPVCVTDTIIIIWTALIQVNWDTDITLIIALLLTGASEGQQCESNPNDQKKIIKTKQFCWESKMKTKGDEKW